MNSRRWCAVQHLRLWALALDRFAIGRLFLAYGAPCDVLAQFGNGNYYNAELPFEAALNAGVVLADPKPISDPAFADNKVRELLLSDWENNPYCVASTSKNHCWEFINDTAIITTEVLLASPRLEQVYPNSTTTDCRR